MSNNWSHDDIQKAIRLLREGKSAREVAEQFPNRTRNAVLGLIHRRGLGIKKLFTPKAKTVFKAKKAKPVKPVKVKYIEPEGVPFSVVITKHACQYGLSNGLYCGCPIHPNQYKRPYCADHLAVIYDTTSKRRMGDYQKRLLHELSIREKRPASIGKDEVARIAASELNV